MSSPSITVLNLVAQDTQWNAPLYDLAAVEQIIYTRLNLFQGEWWLNLLDGVALWQSILGQAASMGAQRQMENIITSRILGSPFVTDLATVSIKYSPAPRGLAYSAVANTQFGAIAIVNYPIPLGD